MCVCVFYLFIWNYFLNLKCWTIFFQTYQMFFWFFTLRISDVFFFNLSDVLNRRGGKGSKGVTFWSWFPALFSRRLQPRDKKEPQDMADHGRCGADNSSTRHPLDETTSLTCDCGFFPSYVSECVFLMFLNREAQCRVILKVKIGYCIYLYQFYVMFVMFVVVIIEDSVCCPQNSQSHCMICMGWVAEGFIASSLLSKFCFDCFRRFVSYYICIVFVHPDPWWDDPIWQDICFKRIETTN